jgi:hypothetical protein
MAGGVDLDHVNVFAAGDGQTGITFIARFGGGLLGLEAVQTLGQDAGGGGFAGAAGAAKKIGMSDAAGCDCPMTSSNEAERYRRARTV